MSEVAYLVRHGEVENPDGVVYADLPGYGLSEFGRTQAAEAARWLPSDATVVSSPLQRAVETARFIADGDPVLVDDELTEWHLGRHWAGEVWARLDEVFPGELTAYLNHPHDLSFADESLAALANRIAGAIERHRRSVTGPLVVVSHQDPIQAGRLALTGKPLSSLQNDKPGHASVITLEFDDGRWRELELWEPTQGAVFPPV